MWVKNCIIAPPFVDGWIKNTAWGTDIQTTANRRRLSVTAQAAVWNNDLIFIYHFFKILIDE